jgi:hypothetical protein
MVMGTHAQTRMSAQSVTVDALEMQPASTYLDLSAASAMKALKATALTALTSTNVR